MAGFLGMRGTGDWGTDERPQSYREMILYMFPNGSAPLTAILAGIGNDTVSDPQYHWWVKDLPQQGVTVTSVFVNVDLTTAYVYATHQATLGIAGETVHAQMAEADADNFRIGHQVLLRDASRLDVDIQGIATGVIKAGANSVVSVKLLEADDNSSDSTNFSLATVDTALIIGNANTEGATAPDAVTYDPTKHTNYTQIFRTPFEMTETAKATSSRTGDLKARFTKENLDLHSIEMEKAFIFGVSSENTVNGKLRRTTAGIGTIARTHANATSSDYTTDSTYSGQSWIAGGETWFDTQLEAIFRYGRTEKLAFCGSGAMLGLQRLAKSYGNINLTPMSASYGLKVVQWVTPFGTLFLKTHPLFSYETTNQNAMLICEPQSLTYRYLKGRDTDLLENRQANDADAELDEYLTEAGLEYDNPRRLGWLTGLNTTNTA